MVNRRLAARGDTRPRGSRRPLRDLLAMRARVKQPYVANREGAALCASNGSVQFGEQRRERLERVGL